MPVTLHVWRVPPRRAGAALLRLAFARRRPPGVRFAKFLGTGTGTSFGPGDADLTRYAALTVSDEPVSFPGWDRLAAASARLDLEPLASRGSWSGRDPFRAEVPKNREKGMVLALTRARLRPTRALTFWRAIPPVARELAAAPGLLARFGIGEAPIGWQGTVSVWRDAADLTAFAYRQPEHRAVIARTPGDRWYAEELFARFAVRGISGDRSVLGWTGKVAGGEVGRV
ncbi:monooxygenase [Paractinoplanes rishiriensis]|uniref:Spheroidene monooxygenase n=1 Tax=Paractinoplanes rishiriensis TaxID=1050105 RepID=A0A919JX56_9ACTN|nr:monooxygenase [Actinoplanes rishiriensis]GIE96856.1 hypothetical protein Ari01nite_43210 [Actinoplanes rishiriensis]